MHRPDVRTHERQPIALGAQLGAGAQGAVFELPDSCGRLVAKLYHPDEITELLARKLQSMIAVGVDDPRLAWPQTVLHDECGRVVGYTMRRAEGRPLQRSVFIRPLLDACFPTWTRLDLVELAVEIVTAFGVLHRRGILVGDVNGANVIVGPTARDVVLVDLDSCQIEGFRCPVGTVPFLAPRLLGQRLSETARTYDDEAFALATLLFMVLVPGKPPYSHQGGSDPVENVRGHRFPYGIGAHEGEDAPRGPWAAIWSHLPLDLQVRFSTVFEHGRVVGPAEFGVSLLRYRELLLRGHATFEIFPAQPRRRDFGLAPPVPAAPPTTPASTRTSCKSCGVAFVITDAEARWYRGKAMSLPLRCRSCRALRRGRGI